MSDSANDPRLAQLTQWVCAPLSRIANRTVGASDIAIRPASEDASFRRYWRVTLDADSFVIMDAPPEHEDCRPFIDVSARLIGAGIAAPEVLANDLERGFLLLTDLGTTQYLAVLNSDNVDTLYQGAFQALLRMQQRVDPEGLPEYDRERLMMEMSLFPQWLLQRHLGLDLGASESVELENIMQALASMALEQPRVFVHLDYHSRNLMLGSDSEVDQRPGVLDFQDARRGPITYDLVSLLRDCYIRWPAEQVAAWSDAYRLRLREADVADIDADQWQRWFDWMGVQRHLKAAGIFARLNHRDGKSWFLKDIPRTVTYIRDVAQGYPELKPLGKLVEQHVLPDLEGAGV